MLGLGVGFNHLMGIIPSDYALKGKVRGFIQLY
jgi:hypothetical protein